MNSYCILEMKEAKDGLGITTENFFKEKEKEKKITSKPLFSGSFMECFEEKQKLIKRRK